MQRSLALLAMLSVPAIASAAPLEIPHQGRLVDSTGVPLEGDHNVTVSLFDVGNGGTPMWNEDITATFDNGFYAVTLGRTSSNPLKTSFTEGALYLQIAVDGGPALDRLKVGSVPFALNSEVSRSVRGGSVDATSISINGTEVISSDGTFTGTVSDTLDELSCSHSQIAKWNNSASAWECGDEVLRSISCANGQIVTWNNSAAAWQCADLTSAEDILGVIQGSPIALAAGSTVDGKGISTLTSSDVVSTVESTDLALSASTTIGGKSPLFSGDVAWDSLTGVPSGFADGTDDTVTDQQVIDVVEANRVILLDDSEAGGDFIVNGDLTVLDSGGNVLFKVDGDSGVLIAKRETPIAYSGYCSSHGRSSTWLRYCLDGTDFNTDDGSHFTVNSNGVITIQEDGYYRINLWAISNVSAYPHIQLRKNGTSFYYGHEYSGNQWVDNTANQLWPFNAGDTFEVYFYSNGGNNYNYHYGNTAGNHSRLQFEYVGPQ